MTIQEEKQKLANQGMESAYNQDCSEGLNGYNTSAYDNKWINADIQNDSISVNEFIELYFSS